MILTTALNLAGHRGVAGTSIKRVFASKDQDRKGLHARADLHLFNLDRILLEVESNVRTGCGRFW